MPPGPVQRLVRPLGRCERAMWRARSSSHPRRSRNSSRAQPRSAESQLFASRLRRMDGRTTQLTGPAATPDRSRDAQAATRNKLRGRVRCSAWFGSTYGFFPSAVFGGLSSARRGAWP